MIAVAVAMFAIALALLIHTAWHAFRLVRAEEKEAQKRHAAPLADGEKISTEDLYERLRSRGWSEENIAKLRRPFRSTPPEGRPS